jgi:hypothetical protein
MIIISACTKEAQNRLGRSIQNWTGTNGVVDIYAGDKLVKRFIKIDKMSTALGTGDKDAARSYRFGYGYMDTNFNYQVDQGEKNTYFEIGEFATYVFYENPQ